MKRYFTLKKGMQAYLSNAPTWMWNNHVQVVQSHGQYAIVLCRENRGKGSASTLAIVKADDLNPETTGSEIRGNLEPVIKRLWDRCESEEDFLYPMITVLQDRIAELQS